MVQRIGGIRGGGSRLPGKHAGRANALQQLHQSQYERRWPLVNRVRNQGPLPQANPFSNIDAGFQYLTAPLSIIRVPAYRSFFKKHQSQGRVRFKEPGWLFRHGTRLRHLSLIGFADGVRADDGRLAAARAAGECPTAGIPGTMQATPASKAVLCADAGDHAHPPHASHAHRIAPIAVLETLPGGTVGTRRSSPGSAARSSTSVAARRTPRVLWRAPMGYLRNLGVLS